MTSIHLDRLYIGYAQKKVSIRTVAADINATAQAGMLTCLLGRNGAGKSTLLQTITGRLRPLAGEVTYDDISIAALSPRQRARMVSIVLTRQPNDVAITTQELVALGRHPYTNYFGTLSAQDRHYVADAMEKTHISHLARRPIAQLSDGERQRALIAKALAQQTPVIILDEPTAFLDYPGRIDTMTLLRDLAHGEGKTILLATHDWELALRHADTLWLLAEQGLTTDRPSEHSLESLTRLLS
ncbi:MAG: ABC transporter ATP-binding protein [Prevotella sp.]|nr:ABC transporter ATP-binding protein [Prevotella sp.]